MAIDPRISLGVQGTDLSGAVNMFQQALNSKRNFEQQQQRLDQNQEINQQALNQNRQKQRLVNVHQTGQRLKPFLQSGDLQGAEKFLLDNISQVQSRIEQGSGEDITESMEALARVQAGDAQGLIADIDAITGLVLGASGGRTAGQRELDNLLKIAQDPNSTELERNSALRALGDKPRVSGGVSKTVDVGGVPHIFDPVSQSLIPAKVGGKDVTTETVAKSESAIEGRKAATKAAVGQSVKAFEKIPLVKTAIANYDEAISALDAGAETGTIDQFLPSLRQASKDLDNTIKRLGLDVVGNTTFGALSESELAFALKAAIPDNMQPAELRKWLSAKQNAQRKILAGLDEVSTFLGDGTKTIADWKNQQVVNKLASEQKEIQAAQVPPLLAKPKAQQIGRFTVEVIE